MDRADAIKICGKGGDGMIDRGRIVSDRADTAGKRGPG